MSQTAGILWSFVLAVILLVLGVWLTSRPAEVARLNDSRGPRWVRGFSLHAPRPARPGRTNPRLMKWVGIMLLACAVMFAVVGVAGCLGVNIT